MALGTLTRNESGGGAGGAPTGGGSMSPQTQSAVNAYISGVSGGGGQGPAIGTPNVEAGPGASQIMRWMQSQYGPQDQYYQSQQDALLNQLGMVNAQYDTQRGYLNQNYGFDQRDLGFDRQALAIDRGAIARQLADLVQQEEIIRGLDANSRKALGLQYSQDVRSEKSDATARGAFTTPGTRTNLKDLFGELMLGNERLDLGLRRDILDLNSRRSSLQDQRKMLDIQSQRYGVGSDRLRSQLDQALGALGLDRMTSVNDIFAALNSGNSQRAALAQQLLDDIMRYGGSIGWTNPRVANADIRDDWYGQMRRGN